MYVVYECVVLYFKSISVNMYTIWLSRLCLVTVLVMFSLYSYALFLCICFFYILTIQISTTYWHKFYDILQLPWWTLGPFRTARWVYMQPCNMNHVTQIPCSYRVFKDIELQSKFMSKIYTSNSFWKRQEIPWEHSNAQVGEKLLTPCQKETLCMTRTNRPQNTSQKMKEWLTRTKPNIEGALYCFTIWLSYERECLAFCK